MGRVRVRLVLAALAAMSFAVALMRPGVAWTGPMGSTLAVIDITQSMNVADMRWDGQPVTRLEYARALLRRVVRELPCGHQVGIGVFTERKTMLLAAPLEVCTHYAALDDVLDGIDWRMAWAADSHLYYGSYSALEQIATGWPGTALAFFTDGHQAPPVFPGREPRYERNEQTPPGVLFGIGGTLPQPVPRTDAEGRISGYWTAEEASAFSPSGARPTLSVLDMERMRAGEDVRNAPQRPAGSGAEHLSERRDAVLESVASHTGLAVRTATDSAAVVAALEALPATHSGVRRLELHDSFVACGALALLLSLWPVPRRLGTAASPSGPGTRLRSHPRPGAPTTTFTTLDPRRSS